MPHGIVAELEGAIVGFETVLAGKDTSQAELEDLFVAPELWRMGVGRQLLAEAESRAAERGARVVHVVAGERAILRSFRISVCRNDRDGFRGCSRTAQRSTLGLIGRSLPTGSQGALAGHSSLLYDGRLSQIPQSSLNFKTSLDPHMRADQLHCQAKAR